MFLIKLTIAKKRDGKKQIIYHSSTMNDNDNYDIIAHQIMFLTATDKQLWGKKKGVTHTYYTLYSV